MTTNAFDRVISALADVTGFIPKGNDNQRQACCPAHPDRTPSLSITRANDRVLVRCQAGCDINDVLTALKLTSADLFDEPIRRDGSSRSGITATYDYTDENGRPLFQVCRLEPIPEKKKPFLQRRPDGNGGWIWNLNDTRRVLYRLPAVLAAVQSGRTVFVVEGEKDVHSAERAGLVATCNPMGVGGGWRDEYSDALKGAPVVIIADRDHGGREHAAKVAASLRRVAGSVLVVEPIAGKDITDHLAAGHSVDELAPLEIETPSTGSTAARYVDWAELWDSEREGTDWLVEPLIEAGQSIALYSPAKVGKSLLALEVAAAKVTGRPVLGNPAGEPMHVLYVDHENTEDDLRDRLAGLGYGPDDDLSRLHYSLLADWPPLDTDAGGLELHAAAVECGARLVILDTVSRAISGEENSGDTFLALYRHTIRRLKRDRVTKGARGSSAKRDDVDVVWSLLLRGEDSLTLRREASRTGQGPPVLLLRRLSGPLRHVVDRFDDAHERDVLWVIGLLDGLGMPSDTGRPAAAKALRDHGDSCRTTIVAEAVRRRKTPVPTGSGQLSQQARGQAGDSGDSTDRGKSPSNSPHPHLYRWGQWDSPAQEPQTDPVALVWTSSAASV